MGVFDEVIFEQGNSCLPENYPLEGWQTKDLEFQGGMSKFLILTDGRVLRVAHSQRESALVKINSTECPSAYYFSDRLTCQIGIYTEDLGMVLKIVDGFVVQSSPESDNHFDAMNWQLFEIVPLHPEQDQSKTDYLLSSEQNTESLNETIEELEGFSFYSGEDSAKHPDNGKYGFWRVHGVRHSALVQTDSARDAITLAADMVHEWELTDVEYIGVQLPTVYRL